MSKANRDARRLARLGKNDPGAATEPAAVAFWKQPANYITLGLLLLAMSIYRFAVLDHAPGPPGSDAGNWLAFTNELFGGDVKAATSMYFPVTLVILKFLTVFAPPLIALKLLAVVSSVTIGVPFFYLVRRSCSPAMAAVLTFCMLMTGYQLEMLSWGGYPQLLASTFLLTSLILLDEGLTTGSRKKLLWAAAFAALIAGTHHFTLLVFCGVIAVYAPAMLWRYRAELRTLGQRFAIFAGASTAFALIFLPWYIKYMSIVAEGGSLNANKNAFHGLSDVFSFVYAEAPLTWMFLMVGAPLLSFLPFGKPDGFRLRHMGLPLVLGAAAFYVATHEVRIFQMMQIGVLTCLGAFGGKVEDYLRNKPQQFAVQKVGYATYGLGLAALILLFGVNGFRHFEGAVARYEGVDAEAKEALDWVRTNTPSNAKFLTGGGREGWVNYAWWVEGYGQRKSMGVLMPEFLAFREEREQAAVAHRLVDKETSSSEVRQLMDENKIDYLFIYKRTGGEFQNLVDKIPVYVSHQNGEFVVLRVRRDEFAKTP
jgi:hypothetical protein